MKLLKVDVCKLTMDERCQARATVDADAVNEYAEAYLAKAEIPPPDVFDVSGALYVVDGYHRVPAAIKAGLAFLRVRVVGAGSIDDAVWHATGVNQGHGVRRTNADKRRAVLMALASPIGQEQSNRTIADHCGVGDHLVAAVRTEWEASQVRDSRTSNEKAPAKRKGKDGKSYPVKPPRPVTEKAAPPSAPTPAPPTTKTPLPDCGPTLEELAGAARTVRLDVKRRVDGDLVPVAQRACAMLLDAEHTLTLAVPIVCAKCDGAGCRACGDRGWMTREQAGGLRA